MNLRALADPLLARVVELLADEQLCNRHLTELTGTRQTNMSNHLRVLRQAGVVDIEPAGRYAYHRCRHNPTQHPGRASTTESTRALAPPKVARPFSTRRGPTGVGHGRRIVRA